MCHQPSVTAVLSNPGLEMVGIKPGGSQLTAVHVHTLVQAQQIKHMAGEAVNWAAGLGLIVRDHHTRCRTFMLDALCYRGRLSVLAKERHGACPSLQCVVWGLSTGSSWEHRNCHSACPSTLETTSSFLLPCSPFPLLCTASSHSHSHPPQTLWVPQLLLQPLLQHPCQPQPRLWRKDLSISVLHWCIHPQSNT